MVWTVGGGPPFSFDVTSTYSGFVLASDRRLIVSYGEVVKLIDVGSFTLEAVQPAALTTDDGTAGIISSIGFAGTQNEIIASQENGDVLFFNLSDIAAIPTVLVVATGDKLGPVFVDPGGRYVYVADNTAHTIHVIDLTTQGVVSSVSLVVPNVTTFNITDAAFSSTMQEVYFTTDVGALFFFPSGGGSATMINLGVNVTPRLSLPAIAVFPSGNAFYVVDTTTPTVIKIDATTRTKSGDSIDISANLNPTDVAVTNVENPLGVYAFVAGANGVSVINTATNEVFDLGIDPNIDFEPMPMSSQAFVLAPSSSSDGMVYVGFSTSGLGIISERPFAAITSIVYSDGGTVLKQGGSFDITFKANATGTYEIRSGGSVDASGTVLVDASGNTSGTVSAADTDITVTIKYDDNKSAFLEGANDIWVFVTSDTGLGRRASQITVDTPPPDVVLGSTGFGNGRIYVTFDRLTVNDMASYNVYVDTDKDAVLTKADAAASVSQPSSGSQVTAEVSGLTNGTLYYIAVEGVDTNGNKSITRTGTLSDGSAASATPQQTAGPAGFSGEKGCSLGGSGEGSRLAVALIPLALAVLWQLRRRGRGAALVLFLIVALYSSVSLAAGEEPVEERNVPGTPTALTQGTSQPWWSLEVKTGFWMPQSSEMERFFSSCCNLVTRIQGSLLVHRRYGAELGVGFFYKSGTALATSTGAPSEDRFTFMLIPIELSFVWRADYFDWRYLVPYVKAGADGWVFRESVTGSSTSGIKFGMHGAGGLQINISEIGGVQKNFEDIGIDDFFLTLETQYQWINNFGGKGLNLTGPIFSAGFLFEF
ncbi:MAG: hypothetical protein WC956_04140 [bacterium]